MSLVKSLLIAAVLVGAAQAWVRFAPLSRERLSARPGPMVPGVHPMKAGVKVVQPLSALPPDALARIEAIAEATPRTARVGGDPAAFVTRSRLWGFPDVALVWTDGVNLHVYSHAVYGQRDLGVNAAKVARWFEALEAQA